MDEVFWVVLVVSVCLVSGLFLVDRAEMRRRLAERGGRLERPSALARVVMTEAAVLEGLAVAPEHAVFRSVLAVLDEKIATATAEVSNAGLVRTAAGALPVVHTAGGLEWLQGLRDDLVALRAAASAEADGGRMTDDGVPAFARGSGAARRGTVEEVLL